MHITGDLSLADFGTLVNHEGYPKLADYLHAAYPGKKFITVGEKSYAVESATASSGDIAVPALEPAHRRQRRDRLPQPKRRWRRDQRPVP